MHARSRNELLIRRYFSGDFSFWRNSLSKWYPLAVAIPAMIWAVPSPSFWGKVGTKPLYLTPSARSFQMIRLKPIKDVAMAAGVIDSDSPSTASRERVTRVGLRGSCQFSTTYCMDAFRFGECMSLSNVFFVSSAIFPPFFSKIS